MAAMRTRCVLSGDVPQGWHHKESNTFLHPDGVANVICSSEPLASHMATEEYAEQQRSFIAADMTGYECFAYEPARIFGGHNGIMHRFASTPDGTPPTSQMQMYLVLGERGYTATATTLSENFPTMEPTLIELLLSIRIERPEVGDLTSP
jgi:hypothetical protein